MKSFTEDRLNQAIPGNGRWANVSSETVENAKKILYDIQYRKMPVIGYVINVDYAVSKLPRVEYYNWLNGVGNAVNPKP